MAVISDSDNVAAAITDDTITVLIQFDAKLANEFRAMLASPDSYGASEPSKELRQVLYDLDRVLHRAVSLKPDQPRFKSASRPRIDRKKLPKVCEVPACGCSGLAHP